MKLNKCAHCEEDIPFTKDHYARKRFCNRKCVNLWLKGKHFSPTTEFKKGHVNINKRVWTLEERQKISQSLIGKFVGEKHPNWKGGWKNLLPKCLDCGKKLSKMGSTYCSKCNTEKHFLGEGNPNWRGGITPINLAIRCSREYAEWRMSVFKRDQFTCVWCNAKSDLQADHIKPFAYYPELRFDIDNGRTLCKNCHSQTDTFAGRGRHYGKETVPCEQK